MRNDAAWGGSGLNGKQTGLRTTRCERPGEDVETDCKQTSDSVQAKTETGGKTEALDAAGVDGDVGSGQVFFTQRGNAFRHIHPAPQVGCKSRTSALCEILLKTRSSRTTSGPFLPTSGNDHKDERPIFPKENRPFFLISGRGDWI